MICIISLQNYFSVTFKKINYLNLIVIVISKLLKRHSKAKRWAPSYSWALHQLSIGTYFLSTGTYLLQKSTDDNNALPTFQREQSMKIHASDFYSAY